VTRYRLRPARGAALAVAALIACAPHTAAATPQKLADSTTVDRWTLPNGMRVVTRNVPGARSVVMTSCYRAGSERDPAGNEGLCSLLAEVQFTAAAGDVPVRTRQDLPSQRPLGAGVKVTRHYAQLTEIASPAQFPGVLHQVAARIRGVTLAEDVFARARATVERQLEDDYVNHLDRSLYFSVRAFAAGADPPTLERYGSGSGLDKLVAKNYEKPLADAYAPSNGVLCIAGNLGNVDVRRLLEHEFPTGDTPPVPYTLPRADARAGVGAVARTGLTDATGVLGIIAPSLADSMHPSFYAHALVIGSMLTSRWDPPAPPITTRFQYSVADEPEMARYYAPVTASKPPRVNDEFGISLHELADALVDSTASVRLLNGVDWLLGGPVPREILKRMKDDPAALHALASNMAARELYGDEAFWATYRRRFHASVGYDIGRWVAYFSDPKHQVQLVFTP
jgi:hypothetical protein